jgi:hypothetical protein
MLKDQSAFVNTIPRIKVAGVNTLVPRANTRWLSSAETDTLATHKPHHCQVPSSDKPEQKYEPTSRTIHFLTKSVSYQDKYNSVVTTAGRRYKLNM